MSLVLKHVFHVIIDLLSHFRVACNYTRISENGTIPSISIFTFSPTKAWFNVC